MTEVTDAPSATDLEITEAASAPPKVAQDGSLLVHLIRPCVGRGKGRHLYEASMLQKNAGVFSGWKMFVDHDTDAEKRSRAGLPRKVDHLGGVVTESWWDPTVPAEGRFGQGAVVGKVRAVPKIVELLKVDPSLVESSINARATSVRPVMAEGSQAWLVEGIVPKGSVDWVTDAGAGGKVVSLLEAVQGSPDEEEKAVFDSMTDDEVRAYIAANRPGLMEASAASAKADDDEMSDGDKAEIEALVKKGMSPKMAAMVVKRKKMKAQEAELDAAIAADDNTDKGGDVATITAEQMQEALKSPDVQAAIGDTVKTLVEAQVTDRLATERTQARAEAEAYAERQIELRDFRDIAREMIEAADLPEKFAHEALNRFRITESGATDDLDVFETRDEEGKIVASAEKNLREAVQAEIAHQRDLVGSIRTTRVRGQGASAPAGDGSGAAGDQGKPDRLGDLTRTLLTEAGVTDPDKAFDGAPALR